MLVSSYRRSALLWGTEGSSEEPALMRRDVIDRDRHSVYDDYSFLKTCLHRASEDVINYVPTE